MSNTDLESSPAARGGNRRKSGRAVRAPELFSSQQANTTSTKRKRGEENGENNASDIDEEAEESDSSATSVEEIRQTQKKPAKARKPAAKKPKVNGNASHADAPAVRLPSRPKKAKAKRVVLADKDAEGLYGMWKVAC